MNLFSNRPSIPAASAMKLLVAVAALMLSQDLGGQVISNNGAAVNVQQNVAVTSMDLLNISGGSMINNGSLVLSRNFTNTGTSSGDGWYGLGGNWTNNGTFNPGLSTVVFEGITDQFITRPGGETFYNLGILNTGPGFRRIIILNDISITRTLSLSTGNIDAGTSKVYLVNQAVSSLDYTSTTGSRILGRFERGVGEQGKYLFPLGTTGHYNPLNLSTNLIPSAGSVLSQFFEIPPVGGGFPIPDPPVEISRLYTDGYWMLTARNGFASSGFNIDMTAAGFIDSIHYDTRLVKRDGTGDWTVDGSHSDADTVNSVVYRNSLEGGISVSGTQFALGRPRPRIIDQPNDTTVCEDAYPFFVVTATGTQALRYTWFRVAVPSDTEILNNDPHYTGARTSRLTIIGATLADTGYYYCVIRDRFGNSTRTDTVHLSVKKIPRAILTNSMGSGTSIESVECSNVSFDPIILGLSYWDDPGTTFYWWRTEPGDIESTVPVSGTAENIGDVINGTFNNLSDSPILIDFYIIPIGPEPTFCRGLDYPALITVNPTPKVLPVNSTPDICYGDRTDIDLTTTTLMTSGNMTFDYTVSKTGGAAVIGSTDPVNNLPPDYNVNLRYKNNSTAIQSVYYDITPRVDNGICPPGVTVRSEVRVHAYPVNAISTLQPITCAGLGVGELRAELSTGADPYIVHWHDGPDGYEAWGQVITDLHSGAYSVTVTDNVGCDSTMTTYLLPPELLFILSVQKVVSCAGATDGELYVAVSHAMISGPYAARVINEANQLIWSGSFSGVRNPADPSTFAAIPGLGAGDYTLIITDINSCEYRSDPRRMIQPLPIVTSLDKRIFEGGFDIDCKGYATGEAWVKTITGGNGGYTYLWTTNDGSIPAGMETNDTINGITAGTYFLEVRDLKNCTAYDTIVITEPDGMSLTVPTQLSLSPDAAFNISCSGGNDGSIELQVSGGSGIYQTDWTGPAGYSSQGLKIENLKAGTYTATVRDMNDCILMPVPSYDLIEPQPLNVTAVTSTSAGGGYQVNCHGGTASVDVSVTGGSTGNYTYLWSTANGSGIVEGSEDQPALTAGTYHLLVKDLNGCEFPLDIVISEPPPVIPDLVPTHITCESAGFDNGSIDLSVAGGEGAYSFLWSNGAVTEDISGLTAGLYTVTITYNNTCQVTGSVNVNPPAALSYITTLSNYRSYEISCNGMADGSIDLIMTSGKAPYTILWQGPDGFTSDQEHLAGLKAGNYLLTITDANLCTATGIISMREPGPIGMTFILSEAGGGFNIACAGGNTGTISVNPVNSVNNVNYLWSDGFTGRSRTGLLAGDFSVIITDDNNCQAAGEVTLTQPDSIKLEILVTPPFCTDMENGEIELNVTGGVTTTDYSYLWSDGSNGRSLSGILPGEYTVTVTDINGCVAEESVVVEPENQSCLIIPNIISPNADGRNDEWNIGMKELYPELEVKIFNRWGRIIWVSEKGYPRPWDGRSNGRELPMDSYHYSIDLHNGTKPIIGNITIVK
jgi:gliding motility-associated-like protein